MVKQAPTPLRLATIVAFALSCFGLLLFLWNAFGGPVPLKPKGYQVQISVPDSTQLALEADVRVSGVSIGKVRKKEADPRGNRTLATVEVQSKYAPLARDIRAVLRQKTLLGETYVELTLGDGESEPVVEGGKLPDARITDHVELEDILNTFDEDTRAAFRAWQQSGGEAADGRGADLNDSLGSLPEFVERGDALLSVLADNRGAVQRLVRDTGATFEAVTRDETQLRTLVTGFDDVVSATASRQRSLEEVVRRFPAFLAESRRALGRLERFSVTATPTVGRTADAFEQLPGTLDALTAASPDLERLLTRLRPLSRLGRDALPKSAELVRDLRPLLAELGPFSGQLNPALNWIGLHSNTLTDIITNLGWGTAAKANSSDPKAPGHYSRQTSPTGAESAAVWPRRLPSNRGNTHLNPLALVGEQVGKSLIYPSSDCSNSGEKEATPGSTGSPACREQEPLTIAGKRQGRFPHVDGP